MPGKRKPSVPFNDYKFKYIDVIVSSGQIRRAFFTRCKQMNVDPVKVALKAGISTIAFNDCYLKDSEPTASNRFPQDKFIKMLESVGIQIKVAVILKPFKTDSVEDN